MSIPATQKCSIVIFVGLVLVYRLLLRYLQSVVKTSPNDDITYELFLYFSSGIVVMNVFWDSYRGVFVVLCLAVINAFWSLVSFVYFLITNFVPRIQPYVPNNVSLIGHQLMQELAMTESVEAMDAVFALFRCSVFFVVIAWMLMCFAISWLCESRADDEERVEEGKRVTTTRHRGSTLDEAARRLTMPLLPHGLPHFTKPSGRSTTEPHVNAENRHSLLSTAPSMTQSTESAPAKRIAAPPPAPPLPANMEKSMEEKENV